MEQGGEPALMKYNALWDGGGDTDKLFHFFGNSCFLYLYLRFCCCLRFATTFVPLSHSRVSLESFILSHHPKQYLRSDGFPSICPFWVALLSSNSEPVVSSHWVSKNHLKLSLTKTEFGVIFSSHPHPNQFFSCVLCFSTESPLVHPMPKPEISPLPFPFLLSSLHLMTHPVLLIPTPMELLFILVPPLL